ncbi:plant dual-specificity MAP kinase kinase family domain protein (macronuclear) [Tetrahymena thermophila SB210]|uniref:non-specific serine/threonine protein kinase n=1 Tax=Tetrahymena thermophila (strain SB210) TaxID=312017 RepID=I7MCE0_TETTS|nr:plant dual-specificity MAP kinase kinase family domain protein [Tetrahymena thermophila SB210]EAR83720.2 plant dual-specificity MAP kinase kinase family domain protein [Tetrahymena thermophila SB210]|eukprot:XP_001031383.2 plant dual-specificity MAP kinase kinase family domain protein [Tetrahymena thermophila SB210]
MSLKEFPIIQKLGEGAYSSVYKVKRISDDNEYALKKVKLMNLSDKEKQNALNEVRILASIRQPNIIGYKEAFVDEMSNSLCIVMEYADNGDLYQKIVEFQKKGQLFPEQEIWHIFIQIVKGLKALHSLQIFHRDLKSANVFLTKEGIVKLGDMNVSKVAKQGLLYTQTGTPYYASPEVWKDQAYDSKSDIWSLGCVLYEMTTLKPPFRAEDMEGLYKKVIRGYYPRIPPHFSQDLANIIRSLLQVSPQLRPSCDKILQMPAVIKRMNDSLLTEVDEAIQNNLLNTIKIPKNLHYLTDRLPKPNYEPLKTKRIDKRRFLQTLAGYTDIPDRESPSPSPEQMKQLVLPKIPQQRKNHHSNKSNENVPPNNNPSSIINNVPSTTSNREEIDERGSEINQNAYDDQSSQVSLAHKVHPRSLSKKHINKYEIQSKYDKYGLASPNYYPESVKSDIHSTKHSKPIDILQLKQQYELNNDKSLQPTYIPIKKKKELSPLKKKKNQGINLLDIEGESKPLLSKQRKNNSIDQSIIYEDQNNNGNRLPNINGSKLPRIGNSNSGSTNNMIGGGVLGLGIVGNAARSLDKENAKIKEITKAYKVNLDPINDLKDRYRQLKKNDRTKILSIKNASMPQSNSMASQDKYQYIYAQEDVLNS